jgi:hypothetical protein
MIRLNSPTPPRLPDPLRQVDTGFFSTFSNVLRIYFTRISSALSLLFGENGGSGLQMPHAMLMSDQDQVNAGAGTTNRLSYNQPIITQGVEVRNSNEIWFSQPGQYLVTFSLQVTNRSNAEQVFEVWAGFNGSDYPLSNTRFDLPARKSSTDWSHTVPAIAGIFTVADPSNDYLTIKWWASSTDVFIEHYPENTGPTRPAIPSVILTINFVSRLSMTP